MNKKWWIIIGVIVLLLSVALILNKKISKEISYSPQITEGVYEPGGCRKVAADFCRNNICGPYCQNNPFPGCNFACYYACMNRVSPEIKRCEDNTPSIGA